MKNIIALFGVSSIGKSETIKLLYAKLINEFKDFSFLNDFNQITNDKGDIRVIIVINGKIIGIESQGDPNSRIFNSLPLFVKLNCDTIICATRTRGSSTQAVEKLSTDYEIEWVKKNPSENNFRIENDKDASLIFEKIKTILTH
ncbi:hypothetical protein [Flavobacterium sp.]|uniref:hypothetical protein n=1 Tax=Flavobacterium sp. TaxID=239 RepID=UPI00286DB102|nr:hypothetical protein [Flavobacterium sp.]